MLFNPLSIFITLTGAYMLFKLRFFFLLHPTRTVGKIARGVRENNGFKSLSLALAGTLGIGNIFGVSLGIIVGGAGSVFWMLVSCLFASVIKYSEIVIASDKEGKSGGEDGLVFHSIRDSFGRVGIGVALFYTVCCLFLSFSMGAGLQVGAVSEAFCALFDVQPILIGFLFATLIFFSIVKGVGRIEKITQIAIPLTTIVYIIIAFLAIFVNRSNLSLALSSIVSDAFRPSSQIGGVMGFMFSRGVRVGYSRGILSNEAGTGTSSLSHSRNGSDDPMTLGLMGIVEVFFDTVILCMLTALVILTSGVDVSLFGDGMSLFLACIESSLGEKAALGILLCVLVFAYSTVVCWFYYGSTCSSYLLGKSGEKAFLPLYLIVVFASPLFGNDILVAATDVFILIMSCIILSLIIKKSDRIAVLSEIGGISPPK